MGEISKEEVIELLKKEDPKLAELLEIELLEDREIKNENLKKAVEELEKYDSKFAKILKRGLLCKFEFKYSNPNVLLNDFFKKLIIDFLIKEMGMKGKVLSSDLQILLYNTDIFAVYNQRAQKIFFETAMTYSQQVINHIKYLSEVIKELEVWERINRLYELFKKEKSCEALIELKSYWANNKNPQIYQYKEYGFHGLIDNFFYCWEKDVADLLLSDNIKERQRAIEWITAKVYYRLSKEYAILKGKEVLMEELNELEKLLNLKEGEEKKEIENKIKEVKSKIENLENILKKDGKMGFNYVANTNILIQNLRQFYDWLYTNYKVIKMSYLGYRSLLRVNLFNLYQYVKAVKWNLKMYELSRIKENLNPLNFEFMNQGFFEFTFLAHKKFENDKDNLNLVVFVKCELKGTPTLNNQQHLLIGGDYKVNFYYSLLTDEELELLKNIELSKELEEIGLIEKEFIENFLEELRRFVVGDFFYKLEEFYKKKKYKDEDLIKLIELKDKELAEKIKKLIKEREKKEKEDNEKNKEKEEDLLTILKKFVVFVTLFFYNRMKFLEYFLSGEKKEKEEKKKDEEDIYEKRKKLIGDNGKKDKKIEELIESSKKNIKKIFEIKILK